jgi:hypothetical protein
LGSSVESQFGKQSLDSLELFCSVIPDFDEVVQVPTVAPVSRIVNEWYVLRGGMVMELVKLFLGKGVVTGLVQSFGLDKLRVRRVDEVDSLDPSHSTVE